MKDGGLIRTVLGGGRGSELLSYANATLLDCRDMMFEGRVFESRV